MSLSTIGLIRIFKAAMAYLGRLFLEKWSDIILALGGTWFGYFLARRHIEHLTEETLEKVDKKYANLSRERAFHKAVSAMLPELPNFHLRPNQTFSTQTVDAISEFTQWSVALDKTHTPEKSMELVCKEAYTLAAKLEAQDLGFHEATTTPNYEWIVGMGELPADWKVESSPDLSIYDWNTGVPVQLYARMQETERTATSIQFSWKWNMKDVPCGMYVGVTNFEIGGKVVLGGTVGDRIRIFFQRAKDGRVIKNHETIPWD